MIWNEEKKIKQKSYTKDEIQVKRNTNSFKDETLLYEGKGRH